MFGRRPGRSAKTMLLFTFLLTFDFSLLSFHCWLYNLCIVVYVTNKTWNLYIYIYIYIYTYIDLNLFEDVMYSCDQRWIFSIITHVFSVTWSEISLICWFAAQEAFLIIINVENSCAAFFFRILWWLKFQNNSICLQYKLSPNFPKYWGGWP